MWKLLPEIPDREAWTTPAAVPIPTAQIIPETAGTVMDSDFRSGAESFDAA